MVALLIKYLVWSVALYVAEKVDRDRIEALEMWIWRRMEKISWTDKLSNEDVLRMVNESRIMLNVIWQRKRRWIGHVLKHNGFLQEILEGRITGKQTRVRR